MTLVVHHPTACLIWQLERLGTCQIRKVAGLPTSVSSSADAGRTASLTSLFGSLENNRLCGVWTEYGQLWGTYTAEGIYALCKGIKGSAITSLRCTAPASAKDGRPTSVSSP